VGTDETDCEKRDNHGGEDDYLRLRVIVNALLDADFGVPVKKLETFGSGSG
jgi:hypothetical protein